MHPSLGLRRIYPRRLRNGYQASPSHAGLPNDAGLVSDFCSSNPSWGHRLSSDSASRRTPLPSLAVRAITARRGLAPPETQHTCAQKKPPAGVSRWPGEKHGDGVLAGVWRGEGPVAKIGGRSSAAAPFSVNDWGRYFIKQSSCQSSHCAGRFGATSGPAEDLLRKPRRLAPTVTRHPCNKIQSACKIDAREFVGPISWENGWYGVTGDRLGA